jgi:hypothetical protein
MQCISRSILSCGGNSLQSSVVFTASWNMVLACLLNRSHSKASHLLVWSAVSSGEVA